MTTPPPGINRYQRLVIVVAIVDVLVMLLFPPFNDVPLARGMLPSFDGFHPLIAKFGKQPIASEMLTIQLFFVLANALAAFLVLRGEPGKSFNYTAGIAWITAVSAAVILLFPPFEPYPSLYGKGISSFDSFNFVFGDRVSRPIYVPLLYLECVFILINALTVWLLFNTVKRHEDARRASREKLLEIADRMDDRELAALTEQLARNRVQHDKPTPRDEPDLGRGPERRRRQDPNYRGPERRASRDRRNHP